MRPEPAPFPPCPACARLARTGPADPFFLRSLRESSLILHKHQRYEGWCTLWLRDHAEHTGLLAHERQLRFALDVIDAARALHAAFPGIRINYENLGNVVPHIHCHLIPRRPTDPDPAATIWVRPTAETDCGAAPELIAHLAALLRPHLPEAVAD
ncbi:MAG: HIT family protein [Phycisphaerales bacterium]